MNSKGEGRKLSKEDLLTPDEMQILIKSIDSLKYKTLLLLMQETACRPEEILKVRWKDYNFENNEIKLHSSKTDGIRQIPLNECMQHLSRYKEECFVLPRGEDFIFPSPNNKEKPLSVQGLSDFLNKLERKLNFGKHLYPYLWRHSILSKRIKELSPKVYEMYAGHSLETGMKTYAHLDTQDLKEELFSKSYKIEKLTKKEENELEKLKKKMKAMEEAMLLMSEVVKTNMDTIKKKIKEELAEEGRELFFNPEMELKIRKKQN